MMEKIPVQNEVRDTAGEFERNVLDEHAEKKKFARKMLDTAGITVGVFIMFAVVVIATTDIHIRDFRDFAGFALDFFLLLFCAYAMYVNCADSGMRAGLKTDTYKKGLAAFMEQKSTIIERKLQARLPEFCYYYITTELRNTRNAILAIIGYSYDQYEAEWLGKDEDTVNAAELSKAQKKAIIKANATEPIKLTPEMIMKRGRGSARRAPLGITPETKKGINFGVKFFNTFVTSFFISIIVLEAVIAPTWTLIASCVFKLLAIVINGFNGYKFGYENIVIDTVNYMEDQEDLMRQAVDYIEETDKAKG